MLRNLLIMSACLSCLHADDLMQEEIEHVVILMLENRSFDNALAWLYENDVPSHFIPKTAEKNFMGLTEETLSLYVNEVKDAAGNLVFSSTPIKGVPSVAGTPFINSPGSNPHEEYPYTLRQIFGYGGGTTANMSGFLQDYAFHWDPKEWLSAKKEICAVMETYTEKELPVLYGLAKHYAVSDLWFSSVPTQTNPNRAYAHCGTSDGQVVNAPMALSVFTSDTIWNRFSEESPEISWLIAWSSTMIPNYTDGPFTGTSLLPALKRIPNIDSHFCLMDKFHELARSGKLPAFTFIEPLWTLTMNPITQDSIFNNWFIGENDIVGLQGNDLHPPGDVRASQNLLANVYTSLIANPEAWEKTLLVITFDEHGGLYDHVPPPPSIAPDERFDEGFKFDIYGVRVPTIFVSPKIKKKTVIRSDNPKVPFDHTSLISTLLKWKKIDKSKWKLGKRTDASPTFEDVITRKEGRKDFVLKPDSVILPEVDPQKVVKMGEKFYLKNKNGEYLSRAHYLFAYEPRVGDANDRLVLSFESGPGALTHGSFATIRVHESSLGIFDFLGTSLWYTGCVNDENYHEPSQWWTVKNLDCPYVGAEIQYGDRITIENHIYLDLVQCIPTQMVTYQGWFLGKFIETKAITHLNADEFWTLEKVGE